MPTSEPLEIREERREQVVRAVESGDTSRVKQLINTLHPADIADLLESIPQDERVLVWQSANVNTLGEVLIEVSDGVRESLLEEMSHIRQVEAISHLDIDEIADLFPDLSDRVVAEVLLNLDKETRKGLDQVLAYPEDTAGGLMNIDTVIIREGVTLRVVRRYLRLRGELPEYTDKLFVVDSEYRLKGTLPLSSLVTHKGTTLVSDLMATEIVDFNAHLPDDEVAAAFERYNLISAPVTDNENHLIGRITIDDIVDVIREEGEQVIMAQAGIKEEEDLFAPIHRRAKNRALWLGVNMVMAIIAASVITRFEATIEQIVALAVLLPVIANMGGNTGMQTLAVIIRGLGNDTINPDNAFAVMRREFLVGSFNGIIFAVMTALITTFWYGDIALGMIVAMAMLITLSSAALFGAIIPVILQRMEIDPAVASGIVMTTIVDIIGFFAILGLASLLLT